MEFLRGSRRIIGVSSDYQLHCTPTQSTASQPIYCTVAVGSLPSALCRRHGRSQAGHQRSCVVYTQLVGCIVGGQDDAVDHTANDSCRIDRMYPPSNSGRHLAVVASVFVHGPEKQTWLAPCPPHPFAASSKHRALTIIRRSTQTIRMSLDDAFSHGALSGSAAGAFEHRSHSAVRQGAVS